MLRDALIDHGIPGVEEELTAYKAYDLLCDWKDTNTFGKKGLKLKNTFIRHKNTFDKEGLKLQDTLIRHGLDRSWEETCALERAKCKPLDRTFFKVPEHLLKAISPQDVEGFIYRLTGRHCKRLAKAVGITDEKVITAIIYENNDDLFDTQSMIIDWVNGQECSNFEKRCTLDDAVIKIGRHDITDSFGTTIYRVNTRGTVQSPHPDAKSFNSTSVFNDDLHALLKHLPTDAVLVFLERLGISVDADRDDTEEKLRRWRDDNLRECKACSLKELVLVHKHVLNETNNNNVLDLKDEELEDVFASISSRKQMDQLTSGLGLDTKEESLTLQHLKEWRDSQSMGERRETLRQTLHDMKLSGCIVNRRPPQHVYEAEMVRLAFSILCTDVVPFSALLNMNTSKGKIVREPKKGTVGLLLQLLERSKDLDNHRRREFCVAIRDLGYLDAARSAYFDYDDSLSVLYNVTLSLSQQEKEALMEHLDSDKAVLSIGRVRQWSAGTNDNLALMKRWRDQFRPEPFHHSSKLVQGLRAIGRTEIADEVLGGIYQTMEMSTAVGINICSNLEDDQLQRLYNHLGVHTTEGQEDVTTVLEWIQNCVKHFDKIPALKGLVKNKFDFRKHENNEIFKAGFFELAEEIMLLELPRFPRIGESVAAIMSFDKT
eukprot:XP_011675772.1 PREDICTED: uncharacterized protein LOC105443839 [Strongylocentrotus purpuratus]